ncbi:MAG: phosphotransferase, partial [Caldilineaceae bacterium]
MTLTTAIQTYLTDAATSEFRGLEVTVVDHWEGRDNLLWRVEAGAQNAAQDAVIKLFLDAGQVRSRRQYDGQQLFAPVGIAPQPLWYDRYPDGLSRQIMVYRWAQGATPDPDDAGQLTELARAVAALHDGDPTAVRRFSPNPVNLDYLWRLLAGSTQQNVAW